MVGAGAINSCYTVTVQNPFYYLIILCNLSYSMPRVQVHFLYWLRQRMKISRRNDGYYSPVYQY